MARIENANALRKLIGSPGEMVPHKIHRELNARAIGFIGRSPMLMLSTADAGGHATVSPNGRSATTLANGMRWATPTIRPCSTRRANSPEPRQCSPYSARGIAARSRSSCPEQQSRQELNVPIGVGARVDRPEASVYGKGLNWLFADPAKVVIYVRL